MSLWAKTLLTLLTLVTIWDPSESRGGNVVRNSHIGVIKSIRFISNDMNGLLSRAVRNQLLVNGISIAGDANVSLRLGDVTLNKETGNPEYQYLMSLNAIVQIPGEDYYSFTETIWVMPHNNPYDTQEDASTDKTLLSEMYGQVAEKLVHDFLLKISHH